MAEITLNKPSGGQLTIAPEDGTSTETVTIPSVGVGKVLQVATTATSTPISIGAQTTAQLLSLQFTPVSPTSKIYVAYTTSNLQKVTGAGVNTWFDLDLRIDGQYVLRNPAIGYPETFSNHRYEVSNFSFIDSWSGQKTLILNGTAQSTNSTWTVSYQDNETRLYVMEVAA